MKVLIYLFLFLSVGSHYSIDTDFKLQVKSAKDSSNIEFFKIVIFEKGFIAKDTFGDIEGKFVFPRKKNIEGFIIQSPFYYSDYRDAKSCFNDTIIYLNFNDFLYKHGGLLNDSLGLLNSNKNKKIIRTWNLKNNKKRKYQVGSVFGR